MAMRDVFDIHFFAKNNWSINEQVIKDRTNKSTEKYLEVCVLCIGKIKDGQILHGLGEVIESEKEKTWGKSHLKSDTIFLLKNYVSVLSRRKENN